MTSRARARHGGVTQEQAAPSLRGSTGNGAARPDLAQAGLESAPALTAAQLMVVPRSPGPVRPVDPERRRKDDLDQAIDEMFGPTTEDGPGRFDAALLLVGAGLVAWGLVPGGNAGALPWGALAVVLGSVLPARTMLRRFRARSVGRRLRTAARDGYLLDVSHPDVRALVGLYERCLVVARTSVFEIDILIAAHQAMVEVATLLDGSAPTTPQELRYIHRRIEAMSVLEDRLRDGEQAAGDVVDGRAVRAEALEELEEASGHSSVGQLHELGELTAPALGRTTPRREAGPRPRRVAREATHRPLRAAPEAGQRESGSEPPGSDGTPR